MRVIIIIGFFLQVSLLNAQDRLHTCSLDEALQLATSNCRNHAEMKMLKTKVKASWYTWLYSIVKWQTIHAYALAINDLSRIAELHYSSGETDLYETSVLIGKLAEIETSALTAETDIEISKATLCRLLFMDDIGIPADTNMSMYEIDKGPLSSPALTPNDSAGDSAAFIHLKTIEILNLELDNLFIRLQYFSKFALNHAETTIHTASSAYKLEEIDYIEYIHKLGEAFEIKLNYLFLLNAYNQKAIQLEAYAY